MTRRIAEYPVPLVLKKILKERLSGELLIKGDSFQKTLFFLNGNLSFARTNIIQERLGEILFKMGKISPAQFWNINKLLDGQKEKVGKILVQSNILSQKDLYDALLYQAKVIAVSSFYLDSGEWDFRTNNVNKLEEEDYNIPLAEIIREGMKRIKNINYFRNRFLYHTAKISPLPDTVKDLLPAGIIEFLTLISHYSNRTNEQLEKELDLAGDVYWQNMVMLYLVNAVEFVEVEAEQDNHKNIDEMLVFYDKLKSGKIDYYELFGVNSSASIESIREVYFQYARKYHPDRVSHGPDPEVNDKANFVFSEINKAYEILSNEGKRREYDRKGHSHDDVDESVKERMIEKARNLYRKAKTLYSQQKYWEAVALLDEAVRLSDDKASYYLLLGLCQLNIPEMRRIAEKNLQEAVRLENWNVDAYAALGLLFLAENQLKRAEGFFRKALSFNPDHALSRRKLDEILGDSGEKKKRFGLFGKSK